MGNTIREFESLPLRHFYSLPYFQPPHSIRNLSAQNRERTGIDYVNRGRGKRASA